MKKMNYDENQAICDIMNIMTVLIRLTSSYFRLPQNKKPFICDDMEKFIDAFPYEKNNYNLDALRFASHFFNLNECEDSTQEQPKYRLNIDCDAPKDHNLYLLVDTLCKMSFTCNKTHLIVLRQWIENNEDCIELQIAQELYELLIKLLNNSLWYKGKKLLITKKSIKIVPK